MFSPTRGTRAALLIFAAAIVSWALGACGGGGGPDRASSLLRQTFTGSHRVDSGDLALGLTVDPSGSSPPISLTFGGPFQSRGAGRLPKSNFSIALAGHGPGLRLGILSTGTAGYVSLGDASYRLPAAAFRRLESSFARAAPAGGVGGLTRLGISPLRWVTHPTVLGSERVAGARTTHIRGGIDVAALLGEVPNLLARAARSGVTGARRLSSLLSPATRRRIAGEVESPSFDLWTGISDRTVRRLRIELTLRVASRLSALLGGPSSARIALTLQYAQLNRPQRITAPTDVRPYGRLAAPLRSLVAPLRSLVAPLRSRLGP